MLHDYYQGLLDTFDFDLLPEGYWELVPALWNAREGDTIAQVAGTLVGNFWRLLAREGLAVRDCQTLDVSAGRAKACAHR